MEDTYNGLQVAHHFQRVVRIYTQQRQQGQSVTITAAAVIPQCTATPDDHACRLTSGVQAMMATQR